jgi:hypothetical protein
LFFHTKPLASLIGDVADRDVELRRSALRGVVLKRQVAIDSVPLTRESDRDLLGDIERSVGANGEERIEVADADGAALRARGRRERENEEKRPTDR